MNDHLQQQQHDFNQLQQPTYHGFGFIISVRTIDIRHWPGPFTASNGGGASDAIDVALVSSTVARVVTLLILTNSYSL
jgi:hypothetical protein